MDGWIDSRAQIEGCRGTEACLYACESEFLAPCLFVLRSVKSGKTYSLIDVFLGARGFVDCHAAAPAALPVRILPQPRSYPVFSVTAENAHTARERSI